MSPDITRCPLGGNIISGCETLPYNLLESFSSMWSKQILICTEEENQPIKTVSDGIISNDINIVIITLFHMFRS